MIERPEIGKIYVNGNTRVRVTDNDFQSFMYKDKFFIRVINLDNDCIQIYSLDDFSSMFKKDFILSDLESGMVVETRNGWHWIIIGDMLCADKNNSDISQWLNLSNYENNLCRKWCASEFDIMKVYGKRPHGSYLFHYFRGEYGALIWQREPDIVELTMS